MTIPVAIQFDPSRPQDFFLSIEVGDRLSEFGLTQAQVMGTGSLTINHYRQVDLLAHGEAKPIHGELDKEEVTELFNAASKFDWSTTFPSRPGIPDEAIVEWILRDNRNGELRQKVWLRDVEKHKFMSHALSILRRNTDRLSEGRLFL